MNAQHYIQSDVLRRLNWLKHAVTTRKFNPEPLGKIPGMKKMAQALKISPEAYLFGKQAHTANSAFVYDLSHNDDNLMEFPNTDAVGTGIPLVFTTVFTADCVPVFLADLKNRRIMLIHSGWRGTLSRTTQNAVKRLVLLGASPAEIVSWIGPSIGICCYEVSPELAADFSVEFPDCPDCIEGRYLDLKGLNKFQITSCGVPEENIEVSEYCTSCRKDMFYSYRAEGGLKGRIFSSAVILPG